MRDPPQNWRSTPSSGRGRSAQTPRKPTKNCESASGEPVCKHCLLSTSRHLSQSSASHPHVMGFFAAGLTVNHLAIALCRLSIPWQLQFAPSERISPQRKDVFAGERPNSSGLRHVALHSRRPRHVKCLVVC